MAGCRPHRPNAEGRKAQDERPVGTTGESATGSVFLFSAKYRSGREDARAIDRPCP